MKTRYLLAYAFAIGVATMASQVRAKDVDVALVLAIDVSGSVNSERFQLQRSGYAAAFVAAEVLDAVAAGDHHAIAVTLVEWSGFIKQKQMIDWTVISDAASAREFSGAVAETPRMFSDVTSISGALDYAKRLFRDCPFPATRRVVDISGDGSNNSGREPDAMRDEAIAAGITINGLPILTEEPHLDTYYRDHVIGGPGAFIIPAKDFSAFAEAIRNKLVREIAARSASPSSPVTAMEMR